ncbi:pyridoxamine 5'-phosphate oxidase family protein [Candidatus Saccharibacteria bacterium]|nr:pyridoxamine 5'-phosphate oxidase family protein [Candidatus Saccharibacteria bacterium]
MEEVYEFLKNCDVFYLATVDGDKPRVRPFGALNIFEGKLYLQTSRSKPVAKQMGANPNVEICAFKGDRWLRLEGKVVDDPRREAKADMLEKNPELKAMYSPDDEKTEVLYFENAKATFYSFGGAPRVIGF